jgi:hypothetical protein
VCDDPQTSTDPEVAYGARARRPAKLGRLALFLVRSGAENVLVSTEPILPVIFARASRADRTFLFVLREPSTTCRAT